MFKWLIDHEKFLVLITLALAVALLVQVKFCGGNSASNATVFSTPNQLNSTTTSPVVGGPLSGVWEMQVRNKKGRVQTWTLSLTQNGGALSGVLTSEGGDLPVSGTIIGSEIRLTAKKFGTTVEFPAKYDGETMTGTMKVLMITREWTAKRK